MKKNIHPDYHTVVFIDSTTKFMFLSKSTKFSKDKIKWKDNNMYPLIHTEITSNSHPFYTGRQKFIKIDGRIDRFNKKYKINNNFKKENN